ncbi:MAG: peroxidase family protein [Acidimicrobiales bacterium]
MTEGQEKIGDGIPEQSRPVVSRRKALGLIGGGAGAIVAGSGSPAAAFGEDWRGWPGGHHAEPGPDKFTRIFYARPFAEPSDELSEALVELSRPGGILDANDDLEAGPVELIVNPTHSVNNPNNPTHTAGTTFIGQFLDHDITRDANSVLGRPQSLRRSLNLRTARFDLDSVYGGGPSEMPELYEDHDPLRFKVESGGLFEDLPRDSSGTAIIAEPRNDENLMISGIQVAMLKFHNAVLDYARHTTGLVDQQLFDHAQRIVRWHWQWLIVHEFLPLIVGQEMVDDVMANGRRYYRDRSARMPVEFQGACYRFGHSMVRPSYRANMAGDNGKPFFGMVFDANELGEPDPDDMTGGRRAPRRFIGWQTFFDFGDGEVKPNKKIDTTISTPLFRLPSMTIDRARGSDLGPTSLATRNLLRQITWQLPSGQSIARRMGVERLSRSDLADFGQFGARLDRSTPLWLYILREAELMAEGHHLGPTGGRIVAEVFIGLLEMDPTSYLAAEPNWRPHLPSGGGRGHFAMTDLLTAARVDPTSRGQ